MPILPFAALAAATLATGPASMFPNASALEKQNARFAPTELKVDLSALPPSEKAALAKIVDAARLMDAIFLRQTWAGATSLLLDLERDWSPLGRARLHAFLLNRGPWSRLDHDAAFLPGVPAQKPDSGNFYPAGATKTEIEAWQKTLPPAVRERATGFFTTIRREDNGRFTPVPYSIEYQGELGEAARLLREAAALTTQPTLRTFLEKRAAAFLSNDYYDSDVAWMQLDSSIEPTIGPYEVYEDNWFNSKAAFESFIAIRDEAESQRLKKLGAELQELEDHLPIDPALRNPKLGALAPIAVVNQIYCSGDANHGVQTAAFNLPNDERILRERGAKRVMLKNVQEAKFQKTLVPIARIALDSGDQKKLSFDAFFSQILMHELVHGLGPHRTKDNAKTVREAMQEAGSAIEEAKADIGGLWALQRLVDRGVLDKQLEQTMYVTFVASAFRSLRFGLNEAHGKGMALQLNTLLDSGGVKVSTRGTFSVDGTKIRGAVESLTRQLMELQSSGDTAKARALLAEKGVLRPEVQKVIDQLGKIPVDIEPVFTTAESLRER
jgi:Peptidase family M49